MVQQEEGLVHLATIRLAAVGFVVKIGNVAKSVWRLLSIVPGIDQSAEYRSEFESAAWPAFGRAMGPIPETTHA